MGALILDPRQGSGDLLPLLPAGTEFGLLDSADGGGIGDVMSDGFGPAGPILWGIEIKQLSDALASLQDGRLPASQLPRMHEHFDYVFLLIEADLRADPSSDRLQKRIRTQSRGGKWSEYWVDVMYGARERVRAVDFMEWLISLHITGGARLLFSSSRETTAAWITAVWKCFGKPWDKHKSLKVFDDSHPPRFVVPSTAAKVARALCGSGGGGIGWDKAMLAAEHFGSAEALINATATEWEAVSGIGKELASRAYAGAREKHKTVVKRGSSFGGIQPPAAPAAAGKGKGKGGSGVVGPHGNVLPAPGRRPNARRRANHGPVSGPKQPHGNAGTRRRK